MAQIWAGARQRPTRHRSGGTALEVTSACMRDWKSPLHHHEAPIFLLHPARPLPPEIPQHMAGGFPPVCGDGPSQPHGLKPSVSQRSTGRVLSPRDWAGSSRGHGDMGARRRQTPAVPHSRSVQPRAVCRSCSVPELPRCQELSPSARPSACSPAPHSPCWNSLPGEL